VTQPPDDSTRRFEPFRDDDSTRAMPPVPPAGADDDTRFFPFDDGGGRESSGDADATRAFPADSTRAFPADATAAMPPVTGGPARGAATPVPPGGYGGNVYGGTTRSSYDEYDDVPEPPERGGKRLALIIGGVVLAILLVTAGGIAAGQVFLGGGSSPEPSTALSPMPSETATAAPSPSPTEEAIVPPPPEGPGPRVLDFRADEDTVDCTNGGTQSVRLEWEVAGADHVEVGVDGTGYQQYDPSDQRVSVPFPCDGQAHKYQLTAYSNDDRQSQTSQVTVRPEVQQTQEPNPLFPAPSAS
jgi:hypothetical protein